jgi:hypothetical protein
MSPKRLDRVPLPAVGDEWDIRFGDNDAAKGWESLCLQAPERTRAAYEQMRMDPRPPRDNSHYQLKGSLSMRQFGGRLLEQWQIKVSGSGRIWYLIDDEGHKAWVVYASMAHPKETE